MKRFHRLSLILMIFTFVLIAAGGLVTSTDSGLSVPDWPLSFGMLFPPMVGGVQFEHTHRVIAGVVLLLTLGLSWTARKEVPRPLALLTWMGIPLVLLQALLGGLTVLLLLPLPVSVFHACLGQVFFALTVTLWWLSRESSWLNVGIAAPHASDSGTAHARKLQIILSRLALAALLIQLFLGAYVRHSGGRAVLEHIGGAFVVTACVAGLALVSRIAYREDPGARFASTALLVLLACQLALGYGSFLLTVLRASAGERSLERVLITAGHQTTGALILAFTMTLVLVSGTRSEPRSSRRA